MNKTKSRFAEYGDFCFTGNGTFTKLCIDFDCLYKNEWKEEQTELQENVREVFEEFKNLGYILFLDNVPNNNKVLEWLDRTFDYAFICNDNPSYYADTGDHWTTISRKCETRLCSKGGLPTDRNICFADNWNEVLELIKENDIMVETVSESIIFDDVDWDQLKIENGLAYSNGNQVLGGSYIPVEKLNEKTTAFLESIAVRGTTSLHANRQKPSNERWNQEIITWEVNEEIRNKYDAKIKIEQGSLYYRGTWIEVIAESQKKTGPELKKILLQFCRDYKLDTRKEIDGSSSFPYDLPWPEGQRDREDEDDRTDFFFDSLD